jgi:hypothetical protein
MFRRLALSLVAVAIALLISSAAWAEGPAAPISKEAFLASLEAPQTAATPEQPALLAADQPTPTFRACQCMKCGTNKVKLCCVAGDGTVTCETCHSGTVCNA